MRSDTTTKQSRTNRSGVAGGLWFLGTLMYFLHVHSGSFWLVVVALGKAFFWPAYLTYYPFRSMHV